MASHADHPEHHEGLTMGRKAVLALAGGTALVMVAPTLFPLIGIGSGELAQNTIDNMHTTGFEETKPLVGYIKDTIASVPLVGDALAQNNTTTTASIAGIGLGGWALGKFVESREENNPSFSMGKLIRFSSLATSMLIALPSLLTAIGVGVTYIVSAVDPDPNYALSEKVMDFFTDYVGTVDESNVKTSLSGIGATLPHLLTCGGSMIPLGLGVLEEATPSVSHVATGAQPELWTSRIHTAQQPTITNIR